MKAPRHSVRSRPLRALLRTLILTAAVLSLRTNLPALPNITDHPDAKPVGTGAQIQFSVTAESQSPAGMVFQWRRNGVNIPGATSLRPGPIASDIYEIFGVEPADCGVYSVAVSDADGAVNSAAASLTVTNILVLPVNDTFDLRGDISANGVGRFANPNATPEPGEPNHGGKRGGASVWLQWAAPATGIARFRTLGSGLDTTLAVYEGGTLPTLVPVADDDDTAGFLNSEVRFRAVAGTKYSIAIDGYYGARGEFILGWQLEQTPDPLPVIVTQPIGKTVPQGAPVTFNVVPGPGVPIEYQWFLNGNPLAGAIAATLDIPNVQPQHVGTYHVRLRANFNIPRDTFSRGTILQINTSPGGINSQAAALRKFREGVDPTTGPETPAFIPGGGGTRSLAGGFTGTQIFNTTGAVKEPGEPNHCNEAGGASYWFSYQAPAGGMLTVDTAGTAFNSVLAVYTGPGDSFVTLTPVMCSSTNATGGTEAVSFVVTNAQTNYIVVDGVGGATGLVFLNYTLASPPLITSHPVSRTVPLGSNVTVSVVASGSPHLGYRWRSNNVFLPTATNASLTLTNFKAQFEAGYDVIITNYVGTVTSLKAMLYLDSPLRFTNTVRGSNNQLATQLIGRANTNFVLQFSTNLSFSNWISIATNFTSTGIVTYSNALPSLGQRFFRGRMQ